jgi:tetratricopeptide (TPR) repeat protein
VNNNLGAALLWLGNRTNDMGLLRESEAAYQVALSCCHRDAKPVDWAMASMKLGYAIQAQARHAEAVKRFKAVLEMFEEAQSEDLAKQVRVAMRASGVDAIEPRDPNSHW